MEVVDLSALAWIEVAGTMPDVPKPHRSPSAKGRLTSGYFESQPTARLGSIGPARVNSSCPFRAVVGFVRGISGLTSRLGRSHTCLGVSFTPGAATTALWP